MTTSAIPDLPGQDRVLDALPESTRVSIAGVWQRRARNELRTSSVFASLHRELMAFGVELPVLALSAHAVGDELRHAELCLRVAARYSGQVATLQPAEPVPPPSFTVCSQRVERALFAALQSSINETLATGFLSACLDEASGAIARHALRALLADEVRHARIGWAVLASPRLTAADRQVIASFMPQLLQICVDAWLSEEDELESEREIPPGHGNMRSLALRACVDDTLRTVIVPGLEHVGIASGPAQSWVEARERSFQSGRLFRPEAAPK
ncbi:MAG TPA: ferritin-like domain-containing protein [Polyangiaceae bacterium]|nr:ferritin-like domain-containing protein [Polyangiaceae bacterium]